MKLILPLLAAAAASALPYDEFVNGVSINRRQAGGFADLLKGLGGGGGSFSGTPVKTEKLKPLLRDTAKRDRLWYGPYTLPALDPNAPPRPKMPLQMDPTSIQINRPLSGFCTDCTVLYGKAAIFYENGTKAGVLQGVYEHHIVVVDMTKRAYPFYLCEGQKGFLGTFPASGFIVSGNDEAQNLFTTPDGKFKSGYAIGSRTAFVMQSELVNYLPIEQKIYITMEYEYLPEKMTSQGIDSSVSLFSVTGCGLPDYHVPADQKQYNMSSAKVPLPMDGYIVNAKGHLHDGGVNVLLTVNDKVVCDSRAHYGINSRDTASLAPNGKQWQVITEMSQCTDPIPVKKGDILQMVSIYDNAAHPPRESAGGHHGDADEMGVFFINFAVNRTLVMANSAAPKGFSLGLKN